MNATCDQLRQRILEHVLSAPNMQVLKYRAATVLKGLGVSVPRIARPASERLEEMQLLENASDVRAMLASDEKVKAQNESSPASDPRAKIAESGTVNLIERAPQTRLGARDWLRGGRASLVESTNAAVGNNSAAQEPGDGTAFSAAAREAINKILASDAIDDAAKLREIRKLLGADGATKLAESITDDRRATPTPKNRGTVRSILTGRHHR